MPRSEQSKAGKIIDFFRSQPLDAAILVLDLATEAVRERKKKSADAKARTAAASTTASTNGAGPQGVVPKKGRGKAKGPKKAKQRRVRKQVAPAGPGIPMSEAADAGLTESEAAAAAADETAGAPVNPGIGAPPAGTRQSLR